MTVREMFVSKLVNNGLWPDEAETVMDQFSSGESGQSVQWSSETSGYPESVFLVLWISIRKVALDYLKSTKPNHFAIGILKAV